MKRKTKVARPVQQKIKLDSFMFYTVLSLAALAAIMSYSAGATMEAAFLRAVVVLLICTILGYAMNIALDLSVKNQPMPTVLDAMGAEIAVSQPANAPARAAAAEGMGQATGEELPATPQAAAPETMAEEVAAPAES